MKAAVTMYSTRFCPYCIRARGLLESKNVDITDIRVDAKPALTGLAKTIAFDADVTGMIDDLRLKAQAAEPQAELTGRLAGLGREIAWEVDVEAPALSLPVDGALAEIPPLSVSAGARESPGVTDSPTSRVADVRVSPR